MKPNAICDISKVLIVREFNTLLDTKSRAQHRDENKEHSNVLERQFTILSYHCHCNEIHSCSDNAANHRDGIVSRYNQLRYHGERINYSDLLLLPLLRHY